jgi:hypothetical protein
MSLRHVCDQCGSPFEAAAGNSSTLTCPVCAAEAPSPRAGANRVPSGNSGDKFSWFLRLPDGPVFGPVAFTQVCQWVSQGRVSADCQLRREDDPIWMPAKQEFPVLEQSFLPDGENRVEQPKTPFPGARHRGPLVLALGLLGWVGLCPAFSAVALSLGVADLREMNEGRMDPTGRPMTQTGLILAMLHCVLSILVILGGLLALMVGVSFSGG